MYMNYFRKEGWITDYLIKRKKIEDKSYESANKFRLEGNSFLGGLSLHLNHLIAERMSAPYWQFGTLPIGIFLSNFDSRQLKTSLMTSYCHF